MYRATHESGIVSQMVRERHAQADEKRLAALARGSRAGRPSLAGRVRGQLAHVSALVRHQPTTRDAASATRS